jgi:hypothetical protein
MADVLGSNGEKTDIVCAIQNSIGAWVNPLATPDRELKAFGKARLKSVKSA